MECLHVLDFEAVEVQVVQSYQRYGILAREMWSQLRQCLLSLRNRGQRLSRSLRLSEWRRYQGCGPKSARSALSIHPPPSQSAFTEGRTTASRRLSTHLHLDTPPFDVHPNLKSQHLHHRGIHVDPVPLQRCHPVRRDGNPPEFILQYAMSSLTKRGEARRRVGLRILRSVWTIGRSCKNGSWSDQDVFVGIDIHRGAGSGGESRWARWSWNGERRWVLEL